MKVYNTCYELDIYLDECRKHNNVIGFVPTMGALHEGHLSLVNQAKKVSDKVVVSIFVNPTQFNNPDDLKNYPRVIEKDLELLNTEGCDAVFTPSVKEMYPEKDERVFNFDGLDTVMEGAHRPGHFNGVGQIVSKLFYMVKPHKAFFGLKDFQQLAIIKQMTNSLKLNIEIVPCDIIREKDGLAMSSRNLLLTQEHRLVAPKIYEVLKKSLIWVKQYELSQVKNMVDDEINSEPLLKLEYFDIVDQLKLQPVSELGTPNGVIGCIAVWAGKIRLIDNVIYNY